MKTNDASLSKAGLAGSVLAAVAASICCIGPIAAAFLGITSLAAFGKYAPLRPAFTLITLAFLAAAFYLAYRRTPACAPGSVCATHGPSKVQRINRIALWIITGIVLVILTFPTWSVWVLG
jgi:mercuric ion transport protein